MAHNDEQIPDDERPAFGQSIPLGDTGDGSTGVTADQQGISNRPGDQEPEIAAQEDDDEFDDDDDDDDEDDEDDDSGDDELEADDESTDPESEPGKPV